MAGLLAMAEATYMGRPHYYFFDLREGNIGFITSLGPGQNQTAVACGGAPVRVA
jgi:hypothetical protein